MNLIFGTTNKRKTEDLQNIINEMGLDLTVLSLADIGWDRGDIDEPGQTIQENSLIKATVIHSFCKERGIAYPIVTDDAGLFVDALNGAPGIYTARYADDEMLLNPDLPKHQCVIKLLRELNGIENRNAQYRCCVTTMLPEGYYFQQTGESRGSIAEDIIGELKKPYFYSVFVLEGTDKAFGDLQGEELDGTYRYQALRESVSILKNK